MSGLLPISEIHAAAPGAPLAILRRVTIPLSCEGTDYWRALWADDCLMIWPGRGRAHHSLPWIYGLDDPEDVDHSDLLDWLSQFSLNANDDCVAARLAGLCARALGARSEAAFITETGTSDHGFIALRCTAGLMDDRRWAWNRGTGAELSERPTGVQLPPGCDAASALVALTLALALQIKTGGGRQ